MDIIKEFQKYPKAWDAFLEWCADGNTLISWHSADINLRDEDYNSDETQRYLLADMQAWLDSVGIYCDMYSKLDGGFEASVQPKDKTIIRRLWAGSYPTRDKALYAAELKGCEIFENSKTK